MQKIPQEFIDAAKVAHDKFYPRGPFVSITLAQWILESAWGKYVSGINNYFGIKATQTQIANGKATARWTHETINGAYEKVIQYFANYNTIEDGFIAHAELLATSTYYKKAQMVVTPNEYAYALQGVYATGIPGHPYGDALIDLMEQENLYRYDVIPPPHAA